MPDWAADRARGQCGLSEFRGGRSFSGAEPWRSFHPQPGLL